LPKVKIANCRRTRLRAVGPVGGISVVEVIQRCAVSEKLARRFMVDNCIS